jgi:hypothetical protein
VIVVDRTRWIPSRPLRAFHFSSANLDDLSDEIERDSADTDNRLRDRILESTVGFLDRPA